MKVVHRISFHPRHNPKAKKRFAQLGIELKESFMHGDPKYSLGCHFDISEDDPFWHIVEPILLSEKIGFNPTWTEFTKEEILSAEWVTIDPVYFEDDGFPEPHLDGSWRNVSFNAGKECPECGIGIEQTAPIHLKDEPNLKNNDFISIFWTYDIFALNKVFDVLSQNGIAGFEAYPAIHHKKKVPLTTIKQLKITNELAPGVINNNLTRADAEGITADNIITHEDYPCGHIKYLGLGRGMYRFSRDIFRDMPDLVKTHEWFGGGHSAVQLVLASAKFVKLYLDNKWRGLSLTPLEVV